MCDAVRRGIDPFTPRSSKSQVQHQSCSTCQKYKKECTFNWLCSKPRNALPQSVKTQFDIPAPPCPRTQKSETLFSSHVSPMSFNFSREYEFDINSSFDENFILDVGAEHFQRLLNENPVLSNDQSWIPGRTVSGSLFEYEKDFSWPMEIVQLHNLSNDSRPIAVPNETNDKSWPQAQSFGDMNHGLGEVYVDKGSATAFIDEHEIQRPWEAGTSPNILRPMSLDTSGYDASAYASNHFTTNNRNLQPIPQVLEGTKLKVPVLDFDPKMNLQELGLADSANKIAISDGLLGLYHNSLENALACWVTETSCPFNSTAAVANGTECRSGSTTASSSLPILTKFLDRIVRLDVSFAALRSRPLSKFEQSGSSRAMKLAIMAFASQWSHSSPSLSPGSQHTASLSDAGIKEHGTLEFEHLLRQSLWNEAQRCIRRWQHCGSFQVIYAMIVLLLVEKPLNEDEPEDSKQGGADLSSPAPRPLGLLTLQQSLATNSPNSQNVLVYSSFSHSGNNQRDTTSLETILQHLTTWKKIFISYVKDQDVDSNIEHVGHQLGFQARSDFKILFWLGIMCDTTLSVLNQTALIISDDDTMIPSNPTLHKVNFWGSALLKVRLRSLKLENVSISELEIIFQEVVPIKVLLWRKVGNLQKFLSQLDSDPATVESVINETIRIYQYWTSQYGDIFRDCVQKHSSLPFQIQSWYLVLGMGWHLGCLLMACYIEQLDKESIPEKLGSTLRTSSALASGLKKTSAYAVADLAEVSCISSPSKAVKHIHFALSGYAILTEPHPQKLDSALSIACEILLDWLRCWRIPADYEDSHQWWIHNNTSSLELSRLSLNCIDALKLVGKKSGITDHASKRLESRWRLLNRKSNETQDPQPS